MPLKDAVTLDDNGTIRLVRQKLEGIADRRLDAWIRWSLGDSSDSFIAHVRSNYLSGQRLAVVTGETRSHVGAWMQKRLGADRHANIFVIRPGKGIPGMQNYLERWTGTRHEFMKPAFASFGGERQVARQVETNIERMLGKVERED